MFSYCQGEGSLWGRLHSSTFGCKDDRDASRLRKRVAEGEHKLDSLTLTLNSWKVIFRHRFLSSMSCVLGDRLDLAHSTSRIGLNLNVSAIEASYGGISVIPSPAIPFCSSSPSFRTLQPHISPSEDLKPLWDAPRLFDFIE